MKTFTCLSIWIKQLELIVFWHNFSLFLRNYLIKCTIIVIFNKTKIKHCILMLTATKWQTTIQYLTCTKTIKWMAYLKLSAPLGYSTSLYPLSTKMVYTYIYAHWATMASSEEILISSKDMDISFRKQSYIHTDKLWSYLLNAYMRTLSVNSIPGTFEQPRYSSLDHSVVVIFH